MYYHTKLTSKYQVKKVKNLLKLLLISILEYLFDLVYLGCKCRVIGCFTSELIRKGTKVSLKYWLEVNNIIPLSKPIDVSLIISNSYKSKLMKSDVAKYKKYSSFR